jgi:hypothetical protein
MHATPAKRHPAGAQRQISGMQLGAARDRESDVEQELEEHAAAIAS